MPRMRINRALAEEHETTPAAVQAGSWVRLIAGAPDSEGNTTWEVQVNSMPVGGGKPVYKPIPLDSLPPQLQARLTTFAEEALAYALAQEGAVEQ